MNERTLTIQVTNAPATVGIEDTARLRCMVGTLDNGRILLEADLMDGGPPVEQAVAAFVVRWINEMYFEVIREGEPGESDDEVPGGYNAMPPQPGESEES